MLYDIALCKFNTDIDSDKVYRLFNMTTYRFVIIKNVQAKNAI